MAFNKNADWLLTTEPGLFAEIDRIGCVRLKSV